MDERVMLAELEQLLHVKPNSYTLVSHGQATPTHAARQGMMRIRTLSNASRLFTWFRVRGDVHERGRSRDAGAGEVL